MNTFKLLKILYVHNKQNNNKLGYITRDLTNEWTKLTTLNTKVVRMEF